jgi:hypothetical protein
MPCVAFPNIVATVRRKLNRAEFSAFLRLTILSARGFIGVLDHGLLYGE